MVSPRASGTRGLVLDVGVDVIGVLSTARCVLCQDFAASYRARDFGSILAPPENEDVAVFLQVLTKMYTEQILRKHEMEAFEEVCTACLLFWFGLGLGLER